MILLFLLVIAAIWGVISATRKNKPELITLLSVLCFFAYYIAGGVLFPDKYFPFLEQKNYAYSVLFPVIILALLAASMVGNLMLFIGPTANRLKFDRESNLLGFYVLAVFYSLVMIAFIAKSGFGVLGASLGVSDNVGLRTNLVYENKLYGYVSYAAFFVLPFISLVLLARKQTLAAIALLSLCVLSITITGQKSSLVVIFLTVFLYFVLEFGLARSIKKMAIPAMLLFSLMVFVVISWNRDSLNDGFWTNVLLASTGIFERITLVGSRLASEYIYLADALKIDLASKPDSQPVSMFVYDLIESDGLKGSKPAHVALIKYLSGGLYASFLYTFALYLFYFLIKQAGDWLLHDEQHAKAFNVWVLVSIVSSTITDSFQYLGAWLFALLFMYGALIVFSGLSVLIRGGTRIAPPFKSYYVGLVAVCAFLYYCQGLVRGAL